MFADSRQTEFVARARQFQEPGEFAALLEGLRGGLTKQELYSQSGRQELKDAWVGAMFALGYQEWRHVLTEVRLCAPEQFPDFQIRLEGSVFDFEATTLYEPGRRLGSDYRGDRSSGPARVVPPTDPPPFAATRVQEAISLKAEKNYAAMPHLAIYLNLRGSQVRLEDVVAASVCSAATAFASIWFITDHHLGCGKANSQLASPRSWMRIPIE